MRDSTKLFLEVEANNHIKVDMEACAENGYDWDEYFINKDITKDDIERIDKCFGDYNSPTWMTDEYEECEYSLIQLRVAETLFNNNINFSDINAIHLYLDPECEFSGNWSNDPGYEESYCLGGDCYLILEGKDADYILRIDSDYYDPNDTSLECAEFIGKFE